MKAFQKNSEELIQKYKNYADLLKNALTPEKWRNKGFNFDFKKFNTGLTLEWTDKKSINNDYYIADFKISPAGELIFDVARHYGVPGQYKDIEENKLPKELAAIIKYARDVLRVGYAPQARF